MKTLLPIACCALLAIGGAWLGRHLAAPQTSGAAPAAQPVTPPPSRPAAETLTLLGEADTEASRFDLESDLEALPFGELGDLFAAMAKADPQDRQISTLLYIMMSRDQQATIGLVRQHLHGGRRAAAYFRLIEQWGYIDPHATLNFIATFDDESADSHVHNASTGFLHQWAQRDPRAALEAWIALPEPKLAKQSSIPYCAECLARGAAGDPQMRNVALAMMMEQPASVSRTNAIAGILARWASDAPIEEIGQWLNAQSLSGAAKNTAAVQAAVTAAQDGNAQAADWLHAQVFANQDSAVDRANHLDPFVEEWAREAPDAAAQWLTTLPPGRETDWAIRGLLRNLEYVDPGAGFQWTRAVSNDDRRKTWARELWHQWRRTAPQTAQAFIPELSATEREWLRIDR